VRRQMTYGQQRGRERKKRHGCKEIKMWLQRDQIEPTGQEGENDTVGIADEHRTKKEYEESRERNEYKLEDKFLNSCHPYVPREGIVIQRYRNTNREDKQTVLVGRTIKLQPGHPWTATQLLKDWSDEAERYAQQEREGRRRATPTEGEEEQLPSLWRRRATPTEGEEEQLPQKT
jgi:hypothetical protein